ncbi:hypothetical protein [Pseudomonas laurylsulfatiphila]|jgi:hypothetical protein|uniref:hypothetical protein n=1 Tax=Pseudomonas laurylsulfatiphila TaxID=2011015 RepID=UPI00215FA409|nr:hypothetical protein [Pseudomonas laurylsulfatiphila]UVM03045.1 hypothetical protein LOY25_18595 [Pseudomonas laurylsulfatiphila]
MIDADSIKKNVWALFFAAVFFGLFGPSNLKYYWWVYSVFFVMSFVWALYLIYVCERYVVFLATMVCLGVAIFLFLASSLAYVSVSTESGGGGALPVIAAIAPTMVVGGALFIILFTKVSYFPFECIGNRVTTKRREQSKNSYGVGLIAGVSVITGGMFLKSVDTLTSSTVLVVGCTGCSIAILILVRHSIRGLRVLRIQELNMPASYTFMGIDEIREARSRWWLGRLLKWLTSLRSSM